MQIINTYKCNFTCDHCCFTCSPRRKEILSNEMLLNFLDKLGNQDHHYINYIGGEIFLNPDWKWQLLYLANITDHIRIVTNGSRFYTRKGNPTKILGEFLECLGELTYSRGCEVSILISNDQFHQGNFGRLNLYPLDDVIWRFKSDIRNCYMIKHESITLEEDSRKKSSLVLPIGRAKRKKVYTQEGYPFCLSENYKFEECKGEYDFDFDFDLTLDPTGKVFGCCNARVFLGNCWETDYNDWREKIKSYRQPKNCLSCKL